MGFYREISWAAARRLASLCARYSVKDKTTKRTFPTPTSRPWTGTVSHTSRHEFMGLVSAEKWAKLFELIGPKGIPSARALRQRLLEIQGFLNYVVRTYLWLNPYLKGLYLTIDGWREDRG